MGVYTDEAIKGAFRVVNERSEASVKVTVDLAEQLIEMRSRIKQLEEHILYPHNEVAMKEAAAKAQASLSRIDIGQGAAVLPRDREQDRLDLAQTIIREAYPPHVITDSKVPMRADTEAILALTKFAKRLLNPDDLGHAVTFEVRQLARRALGLPEVKEYDL